MTNHRYNYGLKIGSEANLTRAGSVCVALTPSSNPEVKWNL
jgi:hypothetical protein